MNEIEPLLSLYQQIHSDLIVLGKPSDAASSEGARLDQLESILDLYKQLYINLLSSMESLRLTRLQNTPNVIQIEAAAKPAKPVRPRPLESTLLGGVFGLVLVGGIIFLVERLDNSLKTMQDVERVLEIPVLGYIAEIKYKAGVYVAHHPYSPVSEAYRSLCTNLDFVSAERPLRRLLVTSVGPHEGKTTVAANLAAILAQNGKHVILMDVNLRQPGVHRFFGLSNQIGLSDIFLGSATVKTVIQQADNLKNISILTSGSLPPNPVELLASACMDQILQEAEAAADILILDGPPSIVADMQILAARVDGVLMVVHPGHTAADAALAAQEQLKRAGAHLLGVVLNRIPRRHVEYYGGYRHYSPFYSNHRYYASEIESQAQAPTGLTHLFHHLSPRHDGIKEIKIPIPK
jgi:polysaccharide biosynthesis transport protein